MTWQADLSRPIKFGCPWHGLVSGGVLTLPNSSTKAWVNPTFHSNTDVVRQSSPPSVSNDAADTAAGREWRNYALVTGLNRVFYGKSLGPYRWVYVPSAGNALLMRIALVSCTGNSSGGAISLTIGVKRMAFDGTTDTERTFTASLSNIGQGQWAVSDLSITHSFPATEVLVHAQSETGAKALLEIIKDSMPIGFIEATITGTDKDTLSVGLAVALSRDNTLYRAATVSYSGTENYNGAYNCEYIQRFTMGGYYSGEALAWMQFQMTCTAIYSASDSCATSPPESCACSVTYNLLDEMDYLVGGASVAHAEWGWDYAQSATYNALGEASGTTVQYASYTDLDGTEHVTLNSSTPGSCSGSGGAYDYATLIGAASSAWVAEDKSNILPTFSALMSQNLGDAHISSYAYLHPGAAIKASAYTWGRPSQTSGVPSTACTPLLHKHGRQGMLAEHIGGSGVYLRGAVTQGGFVTATATLADWNAVKTLRLAYQPVTNALRWNQTSTLQGYV